MKVIDLLNKIANGEEIPKKIKINDIIYYSQTYHCTVSTFYVADNEDLWLDNCNFDDEIEIPEEPKKIEKLDISSGISVVDVAYKLNEIIDYINKENK